MLSTISNGKALTNKKLFSRETAVSIDIEADKSIIWALLTHAADYARWNSGIISIDGNIAPGESILLKAKLDPKRVFKLRVKEFQPESKLVWGDAMGKRVYTVKNLDNNRVNFTMSEKISGPLFPLFARMIPSFDQAFEQFARDLKQEAETISKTR